MKRTSILKLGPEQLRQLAPAALPLVALALIEEAVLGGRDELLLGHLRREVAGQAGELLAELGALETGEAAGRSRDQDQPGFFLGDL